MRRRIEWDAEVSARACPVALDDGDFPTRITVRY